MLALLVPTINLRIKFEVPGFSHSKDDIDAVYAVGVYPSVCPSVTSRFVKHEAQLPQRGRATRYASKFVLCFKRYAARKVSNSKSDRQCHSRALTMVPLDRPRTISY